MFLSGQMCSPQHRHGHFFVHRLASPFSKFLRWLWMLWEWCSLQGWPLLSPNLTPYSFQWGHKQGWLSVHSLMCSLRHSDIKSPFLPPKEPRKVSPPPCPHIIQILLNCDLDYLLSTALWSLSGFWLLSNMGGWSKITNVLKTCHLFKGLWLSERLFLSCIAKALKMPISAWITFLTLPSKPIFWDLSSQWTPITSLVLP